MRHTTSFPRRAAALLLALVLLLPTAYAAAGEQKLQTTTSLADGLTYRNTVTVNGGSRVESFSFELEPDSDARAILVQGSGTIYGGASVNYAVSQAQAQGWHVLGAINTDFFAMSTGVPLGLVVEDGVYKSSSDGENALTLADGWSEVLDKPQVSLSLYNNSTGLTVTPKQFNKTRTATGGLYLLNEHFSTVSTRSKGSGWYVRMRADASPATGRAPDLTVNSTLTLEVTELILSDQPIAIGQDEYILTADSGDGYGEVFNSFHEGDRITLTTYCSDPRLSRAQWACGVGDVMVREGAITDSTDWTYAKDGRQPRSALGIKPDGTLVLYAVDGRQSGYSVGLSQYNLADELLRQGCTTVVNLDGGGSTVLSAWVPGQSGPAVVTKPSDGKPRSCASYLLLVTDRRGDGWPDRLASSDNGAVVLAGSSLTLSQPKAIDEGLNPVNVTLSGPVWTSQYGLGTVQNGVYTAGLYPGADAVRVDADGLSGQFQLHVVDQLTDLTVTRAGSASPLTALTVKGGEQVQLAVSGSYWGRAALRGFGPAVTVTVQGDVGTVDANGLFTASPNPGEGSITLSAGGVSKTVQLSPAYTHSDVGPGHWAYEAVEYCYEKGVVRGVSSTQFGAGNPMRRGDFILILYNAAGKPAVSQECTFADVSPDNYFYTALAWAQSTGLASGSGSKFSPWDPITREQTFSLLYRFLPLIGKTCPDAPLSALDAFQDKDKVAEYARVATATLVSQGLVSGSDGVIDPKGTLTRAQMASLIYRALEHTPITDITPDTPDTPDIPDVPSGSYKLALSQGEVTLASGGSAALSASILPSVEGAAVTWTSSDPGAAAVTSGGLVTNLYPGTGTKTVTITASWNGLSASCTITCQPASKTGTVTDAELGLNIRSGPGTTYSRVGGLLNGDRVVVLGREGSWYQILFRNAYNQAAIGYVSADYLTLNP